MDTRDRVRDLIFKIAGHDETPPADDQPLFYDATQQSSDQARSAGGYGLDSLDRVEIVMAIEDEFVIEVPDQVAEDGCFQTICGISSWLDEQGGE